MNSQRLGVLSDLTLLPYTMHSTTNTLQLVKGKGKNGFRTKVQAYQPIDRRIPKKEALRGIESGRTRSWWSCLVINFRG